MWLLRVKQRLDPFLMNPESMKKMSAIHRHRFSCPKGMTFFHAYVVEGKGYFSQMCQHLVDVCANLRVSAVKSL
jgi:hypothetical protein